MKLGPIRRRAAASLLTLAMTSTAPLFGCGQAASEPTATNVDELTSDGFTDEDFDGADLDGLGKDPYEMISDDAIETLDAMPEEFDDAQVAQLMETPDPMDPEVSPDENIADAAKGASAKNGGTTAKPPIRCKKRIHVTFAIYTYLTNNMKNNGCWTAERTTQDDNFRECHSDGDIKRAGGDDFFYDDTNPYNSLATERARVARCAKGEKRGFEYLAFRDSRWRIVRAPHVSAYFAELYTSDATIDDLYYDSGVFRSNAALRKNKRVAPMLNVAPYPPRYSTSDIEREILKVCGHVKNHGYIGLYEWHFPLSEGSTYMTTIERALNRCTRK
jgi:hypothetical protein